MLKSALNAQMRHLLGSLLLIILSALGPTKVMALTLGDRIEAECSFVNTGTISRDVTVTVRCAQALEQLAPLLDDLGGAQARVAQLSGELGTTTGMLQAALLIIGEKDVPPEKRAERVVEIIERQKLTIAELRDAPRGADPELDRLRDQAAAALEDGRLAQADELLAELEAYEEELELEEQALAAAATKARRGDVALIQLRYLDAAEYFRSAAQKVPRSAQQLHLGYLDQAADALYRQGAEFGDNAALKDAVAAYREALEERSRERVPLEWATTQNNLGAALWTLGQRESGTARLDEAVAAYRGALKEQTRERVPLQWAMTQNNLGGALWTLGQRESGTARLDEAVAAYREALKEWTRERVPLEWATTQNNLGRALATLGQRESGTARLDEAVAAYREALKESTRERVPLDWARTQNNLGTALRALGQRESGTARLDEAVAAYREALKERTRERVPLDWATTQNNVGVALWTLGPRESGTARLHEAVAAYREALKERTRERVPLDWAATQESLGLALATLGQQEQRLNLLEEAHTAVQAAYTVYVIDAGYAHYESYLQARLAELEQQMAILKADPVGSD
jgi:tetratricopeptide (TPR) repeat protein